MPDEKQVTAATLHNLSQHLQPHDVWLNGEWLRLISVDSLRCDPDDPRYSIAVGNPDDPYELDSVGAHVLLTVREAPAGEPTAADQPDMTEQNSDRTPFNIQHHGLPVVWVDLFEALGILAKGHTTSKPFQCSDDTLTVCVNPDAFTADEIAHLDELGFFVTGDDGFQSFKYGRA